MKLLMSTTVSLVCFALFLSCAGGAQPGDMQMDTLVSTDSFITRNADSLYKKHDLPGIFIGVLDSGKRRYFNFGYADPDKKMPFDSATVFEAASITKTFTAYVLEAVLNEKKISDSSSIIQYLPDSVKSNKALAGISFLQLLNHTSGLPRLPENIDLQSNPMQPYELYGSDLLFAYLKTCTPKPDGKSNYSNLGMGLAGVMAERISGNSYASLLEEYIFQPFGLGTQVSLHPVTANKSQGYFEYTKSDFWNLGILAPAYGLKSTAAGMLDYLERMANPVNDSSQQLINKLLEPTIAMSPEVKVCRGWHSLEQKGKPALYWHNGGSYGFSVFAGFTKNPLKAVIVVVNKFNFNTVSDGLGISIMRKLFQ